MNISPGVEISSQISTTFPFHFTHVLSSHVHSDCQKDKYDEKEATVSVIQETIIWVVMKNFELGSDVIEKAQYCEYVMTVYTLHVTLL